MSAATPRATLRSVAASLVAAVAYARLVRLARGASSVSRAIAGGASALSAAVLALALASTRVAAQEPPAPTATTAETAATTADFAWLAGTWEGRLAGANAIAEVTFSAPRGGLITGVMRLIDQNRILVVELITIVDAPAGPEMRFRHFSSTLQAYETDFRQTMHLTFHNSDRDVFENQVMFDARLLSTQPRVTTFIRHGSDEFVGHSDTLDEHGKPGVVEVTYRRRRG